MSCCSISCVVCCSMPLPGLRSAMETAASTSSRAPSKLTEGPVIATHCSRETLRGLHTLPSGFASAALTVQRSPTCEAAVSIEKRSESAHARSHFPTRRPMTSEEIQAFLSSRFVPADWTLPPDLNNLLLKEGMPPDFLLCSPMSTLSFADLPFLWRKSICFPLESDEASKAKARRRALSGLGKAFIAANKWLGGCEAVCSGDACVSFTQGTICLKEVKTPSKFAAFTEGPVFAHIVSCGKRTGQIWFADLECELIVDGAEWEPATTTLQELLTP